MSTRISSGEANWVPATCTLPTEDQPLRVADFDDLFARSVTAVHRVNETTLHLLFESAAEDRVKDLTRREAECCSFFGFTVGPATKAGTPLRITVPPPHVAVLDALTDRARSASSKGVG